MLWLMRRAVSIPTYCHRTRALVCIGIVLTPGVRAQGRREALSPPHQVTIEQNGVFYGEDQYYVVAPPIIHVYYSVDEPERGLLDAQAESERNAGKFYHETFGLVRGKWTKKTKAISKRPEVFLDGSSCDTTNKEGLPGGPLSGVLPQGIKIKEIEDYKDHVVVVYSDTPDRNEWYSLKIALLDRDGQGWHVVDTIYGGDDVQFCGTSAFHARLSSGEEPEVLLIYSGWLHPSGRTFISIQGVLVRKLPPKAPKQKK
jgi:hypothetical protein